MTTVAHEELGAVCRGLGECFENIGEVAKSSSVRSAVYGGEQRRHRVISWTRYMKASVQNTSRKPMRIVYATGPGDVVRTFGHWLNDDRDPLEVAETYSGQFFDIVTRLGAVARVISLYHRRDRKASDCILAENRPRKFPNARGAWYFLDHLVHEARLAAGALAWRTDVLVLTAPVHWWLFALLRVAGVRIVPTVHCTFWTGEEPARNGIAHRVLRRGTGWFWRHGPEATLCISAEIAAQIRKLSEQPRGELVVCTPAFESTMFDCLRPAWSQPTRVLYAGRITKTKGVWDLLEAAITLSSRDNNKIFQWTICGDGPELDALRAAAAASCVRDSFQCLGHVDRDSLKGLLAESSLVVAPTQREFNEGLNKSVVEAVLAGLPVVTTTVVPAKDLVGEAAVVIEPNDPGALAEAVYRLGSDRYAWEQAQEAALRFRSNFFAEDRTWGTSLERILRAMQAEK